MTKKIYIAEVIADTRERELIAHRMDELIQLVETYGGFEIVKRVQQRIKPDYKSYIWSGKLEEIRLEMKECGAELLIFGNILKPRQLYYVNEYFREDKLEARDRVDLILNIFSRHATSTEAKLQIELAAIKHMGPRIFGMWDELSNQGAGIWTSGIWETNTEIMRRHLAKRREHIKKDLEQYEQVRQNHRLSRQKRWLPTYGLVGYTNAGKSSLMNSLTNKGVLVQDKLFATLGTDVGEVYFPSMKGKGTHVLINDTIGFIRDLPPSLIDAFRSTLEDSVEANVLMHVVDCTDPLRQDKVQVVDSILDDIWADQERRYVMNKVDKISEQNSDDDICTDAPIVRPDQADILEDNNIYDTQEAEKTNSQPYIDAHTSRTSYIHIKGDTRDIAEQWLLEWSKTRWYETPDIYRVSAHSWEGMRDLKQAIGGPNAWVE